MAAIETDAVTKVFKSWWHRRHVVAVNHLSLTVRENCVFGFLGPNGAGKTTTIKLLLGLLTPDSGGGHLLGAPLGDRDIKERIGFLPDSPNFYPHLSAKDFLVYCARLLHLEKRDYSGRIEQLLEQMGLTDVRNRKLREFSRGMLQRVGIAQALLNNPDLVILDEPITGLDPFGRNQIKDIIRGLKREGKTVFFSSHILADVEQMCDEIGVLNRGQMVCHGSVHELLAEKQTTVWCESIQATDVEALEALAESVVRKNGRWGFTVSSSAAGEALRSKIEACGGKGTTMEGQKESLEDFFVAAIEKDNNARRGER